MNLMKRMIRRASADEAAQQLSAANVRGATFKVDGDNVVANVGFDLEYVPQFGLNQVDKKVAKFVNDSAKITVSVQIADQTGAWDDTGVYTVAIATTGYKGATKLISDFNDYDGRTFTFDKASQMATVEPKVALIYDPLLELMVTDGVIEQADADELRGKEFLKAS